MNLQILEPQRSFTKAMSALKTTSCPSSQILTTDIKVCRHAGYLENARKIPPDDIVKKVERILPEIGDRAPVAHEKLLASSAAGESARV